jgi:N-acetylglutamate synthase-like GNAT family acetyltransferase
MTIKVINHGSKFYSQMVELRTEILRRPLGLNYSKEELASEANDTLIGAFEYNSLIGCCILSPKEVFQMQLRQMAVIPVLQKKGIGREIIQFCEKYAFDNGYKVLFMHARKTAVPFYQKLGYQIVGDEYLEVGLPHYTMEKLLI